MQAFANFSKNFLFNFLQDIAVFSSSLPLSPSPLFGHIPIVTTNWYRWLFSIENLVSWLYNHLREDTPSFETTSMLLSLDITDNLIL